MRGTLESHVEELTEEKARSEDYKKDMHKKIAQIFRDIEKT